MNDRPSLFSSWWQTLPGAVVGLIAWALIVGAGYGLYLFVRRLAT